MRIQPAQLRVFTTDELRPGTLVRDAGRRPLFTIGIVIQLSDGSNGLAPFDGEYAFHFWRPGDANLFVLAAPEDVMLNIRLDAPQIDDFHSLGCLSVFGQQSYLTLRTQGDIMRGPAYVGLSDWTLSHVNWAGDIPLLGSWDIGRKEGERFEVLHSHGLPAPESTQ